MEAPKEWKGTPEQWNGVIEAFGNLVVAYSSLYDVTANPELKRLIKKAKRQQLAAVNKDKSNNWRRLHGLPARRKVKKSYKKH